MWKAGVAGRIAITSGLMLTACTPVVSENTLIIPAVKTPFLGSTPSEEFTATKAVGDVEFRSTITLTPAYHFTPIPSYTSTLGVNNPISSMTPVLSFTEIAVATFTAPVSVGSVVIDKLPANTVYKSVHIQNNSGKQVDITLYCTTNKGFQTILEYNNVGNLFTAIPEGKYSYVMFVGGRQLVGVFSFQTARKLFITIYKDRVAIH
jgi:hypothetical protein